ncbi:response regulator [Methylomagnum sp.]
MDVTDGLEALAALGEARYGLVFMDRQMPNLDGIETTHAWRSRETERQWPPIPIIALTANAMPADRDACLAVGMDDHLAKPIVGDLLCQVLARWLPERGAAQGDA